MIAIYDGEQQHLVVRQLETEKAQALSIGHLSSVSGWIIDGHLIGIAVRPIRSDLIAHKTDQLIEGVDDDYVLSLHLFPGGHALEITPPIVRHLLHARQHLVV